MSFQIKDFASIVASMVNWMRANTTRVTDFHPGSVSRTMLEATAAEVEELYLQYFVGLQEAIPVSVFGTFGFAAQPAVAASGVVRFSTSAPATAVVSVPAGTLVRVPGTELSYATQAQAFVLVNQTYVDVLVSAQELGVAGNVDAGAITELVTAVTGIASVSNPQPIINGRDAESDDARKVRFQGYISTLARGTKAAIEYGAKTTQLRNALGVVTEYVAYAGVVEPWVTDNTQPISLIRVYVHNGAGATSPALVAAAQQVIDGYNGPDGVTPVPGSGWKAAGVKCIVEAAADIEVDVTGTLYVLPGFDADDVSQAAESAMAAYIQGLSVGADVLIAELVAIAKRDVPGIFNVVLAAPTADVSITLTQKAVAGTISLAVAP